VHEFKRDLNAYLATRTGVGVQSLADVIAFNRAHAEQELPFFDQELMILAESDPFSEDIYQKALAHGRELAGKQGIDAALHEHQIQAFVALTNAPAGLTDLVCEGSHRGDSTSLAAVAGYPIVSVPAGMWFGLPIGLSFIGTAFSEPTLLRLAYAFEQATRAWRPPQFLPTVDLKAGTSTPRLERTAADILAQIMRGSK
jgi:amidase